MLVDTTECIGCRKCEFACAEANALSSDPVEAYEDTSVFAADRRPTNTAYTVVNAYEPAAGNTEQVYVKIQCMHCLEPACASACLVGALRKEQDGTVSYDADKCLGCRYCQVACPFQIPTYEYEKVLTPKVQKCNLCFERTKEGEIPACAEMCPPMAITYGNREELLKLAHQKIEDHPGRYIDHVYGEHEVGGTTWLYLLPYEIEKLGFLELGDTPAPQLTETIQHGIFRYGALPVFAFGLLGALMSLTKPAAEAPVEGSADHEEEA
jgi:Fe-S-cluster-containing dehydrogenase component